MIELSLVPSELFGPILAGNLRQVGPPHKLIVHFLRAVRVRLGADAAWLTRAGQGERLLPSGRLVCGDEALADPWLAAAYLRHERPAIPDGVVMASLVVHGRQVAVVAAAVREGALGSAPRRMLPRLCTVLAHELARREEERLTRVLDRIREKIVSELRPLDVAYQILDGLHQLVEYDHSSAFLAYDCEGGAFRIEAEKIAWTKAKSRYVGREIRLPAERIGRISRAIEIHTLPETAGGGVVRLGDGFRELLDYHQDSGSPPVTSLLSAPLFFEGEFLGVLKIAAWKRPPFAAHDLAIVERFLPAAAVSMRNARVNRSLEMQAIESEVKASLVTLSHAVAHDVNNAVGSILPLAQQMRFELHHGEQLDRETFDRDLGVIIDNARLCQRIFSNMLRVAGGAGRAGEGPVDVAQVVAETMPFLLSLAARRGIEITLDLAPGLPPVRAGRQDLQHIVLNLVRNSLQAMSGAAPPAGGAATGLLGEPSPPVYGDDSGGSVRITVLGRTAAESAGPAGASSHGSVPGKTGEEGAPGGAAGWGGGVDGAGGVGGTGGRDGHGGRGAVVIVELAVTDDGPGIPPELMSKVQEPFFSTRPGGSGLGLAICRALAWQNGGTLTLESPLASGGRGTRAVVRLAAEPQPPPAALPRAAQP